MEVKWVKESLFSDKEIEKSVLCKFVFFIFSKLFNLLVANFIKVSYCTEMNIKERLREKVHKLSEVLITHF